MRFHSVLHAAPSWVFEEEAWACGYRRVAGLDEAGRGPLAGPVVGAAVILPRRCALPSLNDSKHLNQEERETLFQQITQHAVAWGIGCASETEIDRLNILEATRLAWARALVQLVPAPDFLLIDAVRLSGNSLPQRPIIKGDQLSVSIAAASILAKVYRDWLMGAYHRQYPSYRFDVHKGYPTPQHFHLLATFGPCSAHRRSFRLFPGSPKKTKECE